MKNDERVILALAIFMMAVFACAAAYTVGKIKHHIRESGMQLQFEGPTEAVNHTQIATRTWKAAPQPGHLFQIVALKVSDLENMRTGRVNFIGDTKPKFGTLEELSDVYICQWIRNEGNEGRPSLRPLVGNYHGGFATYREAVQLCSDVWRQRWRYMKRKPQLVAVSAPPHRVLQ